MSRDFIYILNINTDISSYYFPVIGQSTSDLTTGGVTMPADSVSPVCSWWLYLAEIFVSVWEQCRSFQCRQCRIFPHRCWIATSFWIILHHCYIFVSLFLNFFVASFFQGTSFLRSGLGVLFLTLAVPLLHLLRWTLFPPRDGIFWQIRL